MCAFNNLFIFVILNVCEPEFVCGRKTRRSQTKTSYLVLKVFPSFISKPCQRVSHVPDGLHFMKKFFATLTIYSCIMFSCMYSIMQ